MKKFAVLSLIILSTLLLASCADKDEPLTEAEQAASYWLSVEEFKEQKAAAAQMNMSIEDHMKHMWPWSKEIDHSNMDMWDDSHMIEDDSEMSEEEKHMEMAHEWEEWVEMHGSDEHWEHSK